MNTILARARPVALFAIAWALASLLASMATGQWHWFARSGAVLVVAGVILMTRDVIRRDFEPVTGISGGRFEPTAEEAREPLEREADARWQRIGFWTSVAGTFVWAYGDVAGELLTG